MLLIPCHHVCLCLPCAAFVERCPICREGISKKLPLVFAPTMVDMARGAAVELLTPCGHMVAGERWGPKCPVCGDAVTARKRVYIT